MKSKPIIALFVGLTAACFIIMALSAKTNSIADMGLPTCFNILRVRICIGVFGLLEHNAYYIGATVE